MNDPNRVEFDATLEEIADVNMRLVLSTDAYRRGRRQSQWTIGLIVTGILAVTLQDHISPTGIAALSALSGLLCASLYGAFHERWVRQSYVRVVRELYGDAATVQCAFELRDDAFWGKTGSMEVSFPWSDRVSVNDKGTASRCGAILALQSFVTGRFTPTRNDRFSSRRQEESLRDDS
jgi:hypothetical protein